MFIEARFPSGIDYGFEGGDGFSTEVVQTAQGYVYTNTRQIRPLRKYKADTQYLTQAVAAELAAFVKAVWGRLNNFRLKDWFDYTSEATGQTPSAITADDQQIGVGDGTTVHFQLIKTYSVTGLFGTYTTTYPVQKPVPGSVSIAIDGVLQPSGWTVDATTGIVTFVSAPPAPSLGHPEVITAGFQYDVPVKFDQDYNPLTFDYAQVLQMMQITMTEVLNP